MSDQLIQDAFDHFDAVERTTQFPVPGTALVRHTVARRHRVRVATIGVAGVLLLAIPIAAYAAKPWGNNSPPDVGSTTSTEPASPSPTPTPTPTASPSPSAAPQPGDVSNATLELGPFPGVETSCHAQGRKTFVNGIAAFPDHLTFVIGELAPIWADVDGEPGDEEITTIRCETWGSVNATQLLALKVGPDGALTNLGYVVNSPDVPLLRSTYQSDTVRVEQGTVLVTTTGPYQSNGWPPCDRQVRGFALRNGAFRQVSGPTSFRVPPADLHQVDFQNSGFLLDIAFSDGSGTVNCVSMANGAAEADLAFNGASVHYTAAVGPVSFIAADDGEAAFGIVTLTAADGTVVKTLQSLVHDGDYPIGTEVVRTGTNGVLDILGAQVSGASVRVTVTTASGQETWTYQPHATRLRWDRLS